MPILSVGGKGVISVLANVAPRATHDMCRLYFEGKVKEAAAIQVDYMDLIAALFSEVNPIPVKTAMRLMGYETGPLRMPLSEIEPGHLEPLKEAMRRHGLIE